VKRSQYFNLTHLASIALAASTSIAVAGGHEHHAGGYCMDVEIEPFHMMPGFMTEEGACAVRDYAGGRLQEKFYPFTEEEHLFNCEYFEQFDSLMEGLAPGDLIPLQIGEYDPIAVPSSVASIGNIVGTIDGHPFEAKLLCASLTNWYQDSCADPANPESCTFQLAQPFLMKGLPFPRVTEVSVFDGKITVRKGRHRTVEVPIVMATRAAGITHLEDLSDPNAPLVGASVTHSLLGMISYDTDNHGYGDHHRDTKVLDGSADLLLQGHIFSPDSVADDPGAAVIKGSICSKDLYERLNRRRGRGQHGSWDHD